MTDRGNATGKTAPARVARSAPTIYDIAELAGVSPSTVSRALSRPGRVSARTEGRIREAARRLNYRVNPMARALLTGRAMTLGVIIADITNPVFFEVIRGAERAAARAGYTLVLAQSQESGAREADAVERIAPSVDGLVLPSTRLEDAAIERLTQLKPLVVVNRRAGEVPAIVPDPSPGIDSALNHLLGLGHRFVVYLSGPQTSWMSRARWECLLDRAVSLGMNIVDIGPCTPNLDGGGTALRRVMASGASAVIAYNDLMAIGLMQAAQRAGISVPGGLSIIGFDNIFGSEFTAPALSTIEAPLNLTGELAVRRALSIVADRIDGEDTRTAQPPSLQTKLIIRGSSGSIDRRREQL